MKNCFFVLVFESREVMVVGVRFWGFFFVIWFIILGVCGLLICFERRDLKKILMIMILLFIVVMVFVLFFLLYFILKNWVDIVLGGLDFWGVFFI